MKNQKVTITALNLLTMMEEHIDTVTDSMGGVVLKGIYQILKIEVR